MNAWERVRCYDKTCIDRGETVEIPYRDYNTSGALVGRGTEEFSAVRRNHAVSHCTIWGWDGNTRRTDGARVFDRLGGASVRSSDKRNFRELMARKYSGYAIVQCRF